MSDKSRSGYHPSSVRGGMLDRTYKLLAFVMMGVPFTVMDVAEELELGWCAAAKHIDSASLYFPIAEIAEKSRREDGTMSPAVYQYIKEN